MNEQVKRVRAADIIFPDDEAHLTPMKPPVTLSAVDVDAVVHDIWRTLNASQVTNRNEQLVTAIRSLIDAGVNTKARIVGAAMRLGFDRKHAGAVLSKSTGSDSNRHRWQRSPDGSYHVHACTPNVTRPAFDA